MLKKFLCLLVIGIFVITSSGCATIMQGTTQNVGISSVPSGATVIVDNVNHGKTPVAVDLKRKDNHVVRIEMPGYEPYETTFSRSTSGWVWGNIVFGGLIGLAVDAMSGGLYKLTPTEINAVLKESKQTSFYRDGTLYVAVVLQPNTNWQKIGQLKKIN